jgi:hypothetical protein
MSYQGIIKNGQIMLTPDATLPEGAAVTVDVQPGQPPIADFAKELLKLSKIRDWPTDMSRNHDHYIHGLPRR